MRNIINYATNILWTNNSSKFNKIKLYDCFHKLK